MDRYLSLVNVVLEKKQAVLERKKELEESILKDKNELEKLEILKKQLEEEMLQQQYIVEVLQKYDWMLKKTRGPVLTLSLINSVVIVGSCCLAIVLFSSVFLNYINIKYYLIALKTLGALLPIILGVSFLKIYDVSYRKSIGEIKRIKDNYELTQALELVNDLALKLRENQEQRDNLKQEIEELELRLQKLEESLALIEEIQAEVEQRRQAVLDIILEESKEKIDRFYEQDRLKLERRLKNGEII